MFISRILTAPLYAHQLEASTSTTPGATYTLSFFAGANETNNTFGVTFGGVTLPSIPAVLPVTGSNADILSGDYVEYTVTGLVASSASTVLAFSASNPPGFTLLDDVSVTPDTPAVPEPSSLALLLGIGGSGSLLACRRLRRR